jgi:hypothetical protein
MRESAGKEQRREGEGGLGVAEAEEVRRVVNNGELVRSDLMVRLLMRELARHHNAGGGRRRRQWQTTR